MRTDLILLILTALTLIPVWIALFLCLRKTRGNHKLRIGILNRLFGRASPLKTISHFPFASPPLFSISANHTLAKSINHCLMVLPS